jgi:hypothetical protein
MTFQDFQDFSRLFKTFQDFSRLVNTFQDFSQKFVKKVSFSDLELEICTKRCFLDPFKAGGSSTMSKKKPKF